jgi:hypothetical protein
MAAAKKKVAKKPAAKPKKPAKPAAKPKAAAKPPTPPRRAATRPLAPGGTDAERAEIAATTEAEAFVAKVTGAYHKASWDGRGPASVVPTTAEVGPVSLQVPASWGAPHGGGGALIWELGDASVRLFAGTRPASPPTLDQWVAMRRGVLTGDWQIVGSRQLEHASGAPAIETAELCVSAPRTVRIVRAVFAAPVFCTLAITSPGPIPDARGKELGAAFKTLRVLTAP